jgi:hypothetical protein
LKARLSGLAFSQIDPDKVRWYIDQIMLKGAAISGCAIPNTEFFAEIIGDELLAFISDFGYGDLSYEEIVLALRINAKGGYVYPSGLELEPVSFLGHCFNIDYFSKVMSNYLKIRSLMDRKFQNIIDGYSV